MEEKNVDRLCRIRDIQQAVNKFEHQFEKQYGIGLNEGMVLCTLLKNGRMTSGELSEALGLSTSNMSKVICSVENKACVERIVGAKDKRNMYFSLTEAGHALLARVCNGQIELPAVLDELTSFA